MPQIVYVKLLNEGTEVWRPVPAEELIDGVFRLTEDPAIKPDDEVWQFDPGSSVSCERRTLSVGDCWVAVKEVC